MNLNKVIIIGNVTSEVTLKATASNQPVCNFSVATNRVWTDKNGAKQEAAEFHRVVAWGRQAEIASQFLSKGGLVMIEGRLQTRSWKGTDGQNHYTTEIVCENLQLGPRSGGGASKGNYAPRANNSAKPAQPTAHDALDTMGDLEAEPLPEVSLDDSEIKAEDLPF